MHRPHVRGNHVRGNHARANHVYWFAVALASALVCGIVVAWSPQFWAVAVFHTAVLVTGIAWLLWPGNVSGMEPFPRLQAVPAVLLGVWGWLQWGLFGTAATYPTRIRALEWTVMIVAFGLSFQILLSRKARGIFLGIVMWACAALSIIAVLEIYSSSKQVFWLFPAQDAGVGTFLYKNQFAGMIELALPISLYWTVFKHSHRVAGFCAFLALFGGVVTSGSRAGLVLVLVECCAALVMAFRQKRIRVSYLLGLVPAILLVLGVAALLFGNEAVWQRFQESHPYALRQELLKTTIEMCRHEPWSGYGLGTWPVVYPSYATFDVGLLANAAHNDWAEWTAEGGLVFAGCLVVFFVPLVVPAIRSVWGLGVVTILLHSWVDYPSREPVLGALWFCLAGALLASMRARAAEGSSRREKTIGNSAPLHSTDTL